MDFYEVCKMMHKVFIRGGHPGIEAIGEHGNLWVVSPAPEDPNVIEYGLQPYFVDKETGSIRCFEVDSSEDWNILDSATLLKVPDEFRPKYN